MLYGIPSHIGYAKAVGEEITPAKGIQWALSSIVGPAGNSVSRLKTGTSVLGNTVKYAKKGLARKNP